MKTWSKHPVIYELNTWVWLNELSRKIAYFFHASLQGTACYPGCAEALKAAAASVSASG
jgi:hypothetical protein